MSSITGDPYGKFATNSREGSKIGGMLVARRAALVHEVWFAEQRFADASSNRITLNILHEKLHLGQDHQPTRHDGARCLSMPTQEQW